MCGIKRNISRPAASLFNSFNLFIVSFPVLYECNVSVTLCFFFSTFLHFLSSDRPLDLLFHSLCPCFSLFPLLLFFLCISAHRCFLCLTLFLTLILLSFSVYSIFDLRCLSYCLAVQTVADLVVLLIHSKVG